MLPASIGFRPVSSEPTRVLIAEDEALIRLDLKEMLEEEGYQVVAEVGDGQQAVDQARSAGAQPAPTYPAASPTTPPATAPVATAPPTSAPPRARVLSLVTRNIGTAQNADRVYLQPGKVDADQARQGAHPEFVVRRGQLLRMRVDNQDQFIHSFTFAKSRVNLDAWEGTVSATTFKAPTAPGTYQFYCRYRKLGMSGTLVVR